MEEDQSERTYRSPIFKRKSSTPLPIKRTNGQKREFLCFCSTAGFTARYNPISPINNANINCQFNDSPNTKTARKTGSTKAILLAKTDVDAPFFEVTKANKLNNVTKMNPRLKVKNKQFWQSKACLTCKSNNIKPVAPANK